MKMLFFFLLKSPMIHLLFNWALRRYSTPDVRVSLHRKQSCALNHCKYNEVRMTTVISVM